MVIVDSDESLILRMLVEIDVEIDSKARRLALPSIHVLPFVEILAEDIGVPDPRIELVLISLSVSLYLRQLLTHLSSRISPSRVCAGGRFTREFNTIRAALEKKCCTSQHSSKLTATLAILEQ